MAGGKNAQTNGVPQKKGAVAREGLKYLLPAVLLIFIVLLVDISAVTHEYGPYMGRVIDKETGEPIDGAAVFLVFYTESFYAVSSYAGAIETITDENGEFELTKKRIFTFHPFSRWKPYCLVTIFKPEYGCFPNHRESGPKYKYSYSIPMNEYYTVKLKKLATVEERKKNIVDARPSGAVPDIKAVNLLKLIDEEETNIWSNK